MWKIRNISSLKLCLEHFFSLLNKITINVIMLSTAYEKQATQQRNLDYLAQTYKLFYAHVFYASRHPLGRKWLYHYNYFIISSQYSNILLTSKFSELRSLKILNTVYYEKILISSNGNYINAFIITYFIRWKFHGHSSFVKWDESSDYYFLN